MNRIPPSRKIKQGIEETFQGWEERGLPYPIRPEGFRVRGQFVDIKTTVSYDQPGVEVCIPYDSSEPNPQNLKLFHSEGGHWQDVTTHVATDNHLICGEVDSLSAFFVGEETDGEEGGCFIATAAYGTSTAAEIDTLRAFRDDVLLQSTVGSQLVEWYYQTSPPVADFIAENSLLRTLVREVLVDPVAFRWSKPRRVSGEIKAPDRRIAGATR